MSEPIIWEGKPYSRVFFRPDDYVNFPMMLVFYVGAVALSVLSHWGLIFAAILTPCAVYLLGFRFLHDAFLRRRLRYTLTDSWLVIKKIDGGDEYAQMSIPLEKLVHIKPLWSGRIASIELPLTPRRVATEVFNGWDSILPASLPFQRLELIEDAGQVCELIRLAALTRVQARATASR